MERLKAILEFLEWKYLGYVFILFGLILLAVSFLNIGLPHDYRVQLSPIYDRLVAPIVGFLFILVGSFLAYREYITVRLDEGSRYFYTTPDRGIAASLQDLTRLFTGKPACEAWSKGRAGV